MGFSVRAEKHLSKIKPETPPHLREQIIAEAERMANEDVFGVGYKTDRHGNPIEQGIGAVGNESEQHFASLLRSEGSEAEKAARERAARLKANR